MLQGVESAEAEKLYLEMRDCLIFTNRSRSQLMRHNNSYRSKVAQLKTDVAKLQSSINALSLEKRDLVQSKQDAIAALQREMGTLAQHLDRLSDAFDDVANFDVTGPKQFGFLAASVRFFRFLRAVRSIVLWWRQDESSATQPFLPTSSQPSDDSEDRCNNSQMYTDPASNGRSLLDR
jgi:DNA repair exonuclease SbcCD ATPase subunit